MRWRMMVRRIAAAGARRLSRVWVGSRMAGEEGLTVVDDRGL